MSILGIGPLELFFIVIIALIVLGPRDMVKAGRSIGRLLRRTIFSPTWMNVQNKVRNLPYELMREAGLEEEDMKISPKDLDLGLDQIDLQKSTAEFSKEVEQAIDIPTEWTAIPSSSTAAASGGSTPTREPEDSGTNSSSNDEPEAKATTSSPAVSPAESGQD
jgi:Sec-independent protein translocase protein TatA